MAFYAGQFTGTGVALITPFEKDFSIDYTALEKVIEYVINGGIEYLVALGTTGETPTLSKDEKKEIVNFTYEKVNGRVPVVVGIGGNHTYDVAKDFEALPLDKAAAVLSASPYYNKPSQQGLFEHYKFLAAACPKPLILYNVPGRTGRNLAAETTVRLANEVENIIGIKEASGDMLQCMQILKDCPPDFFVVSGDDNLAMPQIACGMQGIISVAANAFPKDFSEMIRLSLQMNFAEAKKINDKLLSAYEIMFAENNPAGVKAFMYEQGLIENITRLPVTPLSHFLQGKIKTWLQ